MAFFSPDGAQKCSAHEHSFLFRFEFDFDILRKFRSLIHTTRPATRLVLFNRSRVPFFWSHTPSIAKGLARQSLLCFEDPQTSTSRPRTYPAERKRASRLDTSIANCPFATSQACLPKTTCCRRMAWIISDYESPTDRQFFSPPVISLLADSSITLLRMSRQSHLVWLLESSKQQCGSNWAGKGKGQMVRLRGVMILLADTS